jgi:hypothetical protein
VGTPQRNREFSSGVCLVPWTPSSLPSAGGRLHGRKRVGLLVAAHACRLTENRSFGIDSAVSVGEELFKEAQNARRSQRVGRHALNCARLAQTFTSPHAREEFARLAGTWIKLAEDLERMLTLIEGVEVDDNATIDTAE